MCWLRASTPEGCCRGRAEGMPEARGEHGDAADPGVEGMMPIVEVALEHKMEGRTEGRTSVTWAPNARPTTRRTFAAAATGGYRTAGWCVQRGRAARQRSAVLAGLHVCLWGILVTYGETVEGVEV